MSTQTVAARLDKSTIVRSVEAPPSLDALPPLVELADGTRLRVRPIRPDDEPALAALFGRLSARSVYQRFLTPFARVPAEWVRHFANVDHRRRIALVAEDVAGALRAVAQLEPGLEPESGEIAVTVDDGWHGRGIGTALLDRLLTEAERHGVRRFTADVLAENRPMLRMIWRLGEIRRRELDHGVLTIEFERRRAVQGRLA
jgi:RimJ/RimL family protein N-acetyltransferase